MLTPKLEALASTLKSLDEKLLIELFAKSDVAEVALAVRLLPLERGNQILASVDPNLARAALERVATEIVDRKAERRLMRNLSRVARARRGWVLVALDWLATILGTLRRESRI